MSRGHSRQAGPGRTSGVRELRLRRADDLAVVERRLARNDLPTADLRSGSGRFFVGVVPSGAVEADIETDSVGSDTAGATGTDARPTTESDDERAVGVGGFERYGTDALLRSVVVDRGVRGAGYGTALCAGIERRARQAGVESMWGLTTTASAFFTDRGYERVERAAAPASIRRTEQFAELCPDSATLLYKRLE